ncbi:DUF1311 domain-containing protein [Bacillus thermocopriae]|jgi:uncharacterized protein YecT (DUF1311 family)|uniref:DUF1311 domain-containing protein n=1 Tax=Neobacillus thermocopriae TaxID=1215031 RepID=A0A6B3TS32_9BACI|nr:lysozyme inhibitor LprI family protein [Neobacillus thermocopriae]NEX79613.1 DUF1311 domain-containing protein [Neobacillus thermocopriae]
MLKNLFIFVATVVLGIGGYWGYQEFVAPKVEKVDLAKEKQNLKESKAIELNKEEANNILKTTLDSIFEVFDKAGEKYGWGNNNPADFNKIRNYLLSFAFKEFTDTTLKDLTSEYYCECDQSFKPNYHNDVRFTYELTKDNILKINVLEPATEINNMGALWEFELKKEANKWKMYSWNHHSLLGEDIHLTKEEAEKLLSSNNEKLEFVKEYESKEAKGKAYLFKIHSSTGESLVAISSKDTSLVYDFEDTQESVKPTNKEVNQGKKGFFKPANKELNQANNEPTSQLEENKSEQNKTASRKNEYMAKLYETELKERKNEYQSDFQMRDDYIYNYQLWDDMLNEIYGVLKTQLSETEMTNLRNEQRKWIKTRDETAQARYDEEGRGTMSAMVEAETLFKLTKERCYELVRDYMR